MTVCSQVKGFARHHEHIADLFSLLAIVLLFGTIWVGIEYQLPIFQWMKQNIPLHGSAVILTIMLDVFFIFFFLNIGSTRFTEESDDHCFGTFRGRRHGGPSIGKAFHNWLHHLEHVSKKHR
jgi:hypothetical protein